MSFSIYELRWFIFAMTVAIMLSNIGVQFLFGKWLTWGAFVYPFAFFITDVVNRVYGSTAARKVVFSGLVVGIMCSFIGTQIHGEFGPLVTWRIAVGSAVAFLVAQMLNVWLFSEIRKEQTVKGGPWFLAPALSSLVASMLDTWIFFGIAFSEKMTWIHTTTDVDWANEIMPIFGFGTLASLWVSLAIADWILKIILALMFLLPYWMAEMLASDREGTIH